MILLLCNNTNCRLELLIILPKAGLLNVIAKIWDLYNNFQIKIDLVTEQRFVFMTQALKNKTIPFASWPEVIIV